jgi:hypothetical protein
MDDDNSVKLADGSISWVAIAFVLSHSRTVEVVIYTS